VEDNDTQALQHAGAAVMAMDVRYRNATPADRIRLKRTRDQLWATYVLARNRLLEQGVLVTDDELGQMDALKADLGDAAETMAFARAALKLTGILARIALA